MSHRDVSPSNLDDFSPDDLTTAEQFAVVQRDESARLAELTCAVKFLNVFANPSLPKAQLSGDLVAAIREAAILVRDRFRDANCRTEGQWMSVHVAK